MSREEDFWVSDAADDFNFVNHNDTNYEEFRDFAKNIDERFSALEAKRAKAERIAALEKWDNSLPARWKDAKLNLIKKPVVGKILEILKKNLSSSFFFTGESGSGKTFVAYALVRRLIGHGLITPTQIRMISEKEMLGYATRGFKGADAFGEIFDSKYKLYIFDGIGSLSPMEEEKVSGLWEQIIDHVFTRDLVAIFTSGDKLENFTKNLSPSSETKLLTLIGDRELMVEFEGSIAKKNRPS